MIDLLFEGKTVDWTILEQMHKGKTAGLISAALEFGGIIAEAPAKDMAALRKSGMAMGVAFQLIDDVLDYTGRQEELGKTVGSDRDNAKSTAVSLLGIQGAQAKAASLLQEAKDSLNTLSHPTPLLSTLFHQMINRQK